MRKRAGWVGLGLWLLAMVAPAGVFAADVDAGVMVSARPLALMYAALRPQQPVQVLLPDDRDMHEYSLAVSDIQRLQQARVFFWLGQKSEPFLVPLSQRFAGRQQWVALADQTGHAWLDRQQLALMLDRMVTALAKLYPDEKAAIESRQQALQATIDARFGYWQKELAPYADQPFLLGHDAYVAFSRQLGLRQPVMYRSSSDHGHVQAGMQELIRIQQRLASGEIRCAMEEPEVSFAALAKRYKSLKRERLEPMAGSIPVSESGYIAFIDASARAFASCLK